MSSDMKSDVRNEISLTRRPQKWHYTQTALKYSKKTSSPKFPGEYIDFWTKQAATRCQLRRARFL